MAPGAVALLYPPTCDPTAPYLAVPMLTGFLRAHGVEVLPIDGNLEACEWLLAPGPLAAVRDQLEERLGALDRKAALGHADQLAYLALARARAEAHAVPGAIADAVATLRDPIGFFEPPRYAGAVATIDAAMRVVSAAYHPLHVDFTAYRSPFALTSAVEIARDAAERDPWDGYVRGVLGPRLAAARPRIVGLSVCFPGQLQPAYAFAAKLRGFCPDAHFTIGGPAITQMMIRLRGERLAAALGPFDSAVLYEGEHTLLALARACPTGVPGNAANQASGEAVGPGRPVSGVAALRDLPNLVLRDRLQGARYLPGHGMVDLAALPAPDFDGLPLDRYLAPHLTLPYDPTRGCYWGKCTFCHYGLAEVGTAAYRERPVATMIDHLGALAAKHGTRYFYLSQDSVAPKTLVKLAGALCDAGLELRWATDLKAEKYLTAERAQTLRRAGAVACAIGVESASPRVLELIDKGAPVEVLGDVVARLSDAGVAAEAMCFTDFPSETAAEAIETLAWIDARREQVACFIVGTFGLTHGALVAQAPARFGLAELWQLDGDELGLGLFYREAEVAKSAADRDEVDLALGELARGWWLRTYPWAGAVSTAHTVLYYDRRGPGALRELAAVVEPTIAGARARHAELRYDLAGLAEAEAHEGAIWDRLVQRERRVSRAAYDALAAELPVARPAPRRYRFMAGEAPRTARATARGRRPSHAPRVTGTRS